MEEEAEAAAGPLTLPGQWRWPQTGLPTPRPPPSGSDHLPAPRPQQPQEWSPAGNSGPTRLLDAGLQTMGVNHHHAVVSFAFHSNTEQFPCNSFFLLFKSKLL